MKLKIIKLFILFFTILFLPINSYGLIKAGPWLQNISSDSVQIIWQTESREKPGSVSYGETTNYGNTQEAELKEFNLNIFIANIKNLSPQKLYYFKVTQGDDTKLGKFFTPPTKLDKSFKFVVIGDTRTGHTHHQSVIDAILKYFKDESPELFFNTGDLVESGEKEEEWVKFFEIEKNILPNTIFNPIYGNHDTGDPPYPSLFKKYFSTELYYSFNYGNSHFLIINTEDDTLSISGSPQRVFIEEDLKNASLDPNIYFKFVFFHKPGVTTGEGHDPATVITGPNGLIDVFEEYNVDIAFAGHNHNYEHTLLNGIHHIVTGGGGAGLYGFNKTSEYTVYKEETWHFTYVKVEGENYHFEAHKVSEEGGELLGIIDSYDSSVLEGGYPGETPKEFKPVSGPCGFFINNNFYISFILILSFIFILILSKRIKNNG